MSDLDELIQADAENVLNSRQILADFDPELSAAFDTAAGMFKTFSRCMKGALDDSADWSTLRECTEELGIDAGALVSRVQSDSSDGPTLDRARAAWRNIFARRARGIIFLLLQRYFMWGATDLLRMRITPAVGYGRLEAEALGLLFLMRDDATIANRWLKLASDRAGKAFYKEFQPRLLAQIGHLDLDGAYEMGSGGSLHVRLASAVRGLALKEGIHEISLGFQELQRDDPFHYFLVALCFLRTQERIFGALTGAFPGVTDPIWDERVRFFSRTVDYLWQRLEEGFPEQCDKYRRMAQEP